VGLMAPSHERGFQKSLRALALSACSSRFFISTRRVVVFRGLPRDCWEFLCGFLWEHNFADS
jgi:hypothetical protein